MTLHTSFNPRSRAGSDLQEASTCWTPAKLQSTLPRGERHTAECHCHDHTGFNPRSRAGSDGRETPVWHTLAASIHAPARGATDRDADILYLVAASIHAPARGATQLLGGFVGVLLQLQSTLPRGERHDGLHDLLDELQSASIHAPARGATGHQPVPVLAIKLQSTLPRGERP